ncbi:MAG: signal recognition particle-docking protein FtsY [Methylococcales bacterium]|nr:signal recognition particle-docking protein FtsY [Methylococcales bacterium]
MLRLRNLAWIGVVMAFIAMLSSMAVFYIGGDQTNYPVSFAHFFDSRNPWLLLAHHYSLAASILLVLAFTIAAFWVSVNRLAVILIAVVLVLLLATDMVLDVECVFCRLDGHTPGFNYYQHFLGDGLLVWLWYWLSLRLQSRIVKIPAKTGLRVLAVCGLFLLIPSYWGSFDIAALSHVMLAGMAVVLLAVLAGITLLTKQPAAIRKAGIGLSILLLLTVLSGVLQIKFAVDCHWVSIIHTGFAVLLMLPLLAISFYARYAVVEPDQVLSKPAQPLVTELKREVVAVDAGMAAEVAYVEAAPESLYLRLKSQLKRTRSGLGGVLASITLGQRKIDADLLEEIEASMILADIGMDATMEIIGRLSEKTERQQLGNAEALAAALKQELLDMLEPCSQPLVIPKQDTPYVILVVGVNGAGKTTTIGKLAKRLQAQGHSVMLAAGDTFRAAAVEQLQVWGQRNHIHVVAQHTGADSASVIYDGVQSALAKGVDVLIADTAGRLHTKSNLMEELKKIKRIMSKLDETAPHEVLLVLDAGTGQNALSQTKIFNEAVALTGLVLTKLDGTAKGGIIFALAKQFGLPIRYIGIGEGIDDLQNFDAESFVDALFVKDE